MALQLGRPYSVYPLKPSNKEAITWNLSCDMALSHIGEDALLRQAPLQTSQTYSLFDEQAALYGSFIPK